MVPGGSSSVINAGFVPFAIQGDLVKPFADCVLGI